MNKDIQTLIEREAEEIASKSLYPDKITNITVYSKACVNNYFKAGAHFALSLFKWRKVSSKLPEQDESLLIDTTRNAYKGGNVGVIKTTQVIVRYKNNTYDIAERCKCVGDSYFWWSCHESFDKNDDMFITEWMPIPQID